MPAPITPNLVTYDGAYGITFDYPSAWQYEENQSEDELTVYFFKGDSSSFVFTHSEAPRNAGKRTAEDYTAILAMAFPDVRVLAVEDTVIDGYPAQKATYACAFEGKEYVGCVYDIVVGYALYSFSFDYPKEESAAQARTHDLVIESIHFE